MMDLDWNVVGTAIAGVAAVATGIWGGILKFKKSVAEAKADVATARSEQTVADAQGKVYELLKDRLVAVEAKVEQLEKKVAARDETIRQLHKHISRLEQLMREAGIEPPTLVMVGGKE